MVAPFLFLFACSNDYKVVELPSEAYALNVSSPEYGAFFGDEPVVVSGTIQPANAVLTVDGQQVIADENGAFTYELPIADAYEIVDIQMPQADIRSRIPVFSGQHPSETWPGGLAARVLPSGLDALGAQLGALVDETGWASLISAQLPELDTGWIGLQPVGVLHEPTVVAMSGTDDGIAIDFTLNNVGIEYELWFDVFGTVSTEPVSFYFNEIAIGSTAAPIIDDSGVLIFSLLEANVVLDDPDITFGQLQGQILEWLIEQANDFILVPISELILDTILSELGSVELGGPFAFETDLMGTPLGIELSDIYGDPEGLAIGLDVALGTTLAEVTNIVPMPGVNDAPDAQLAVALHEGLFQSLLSDQLLTLLNQNLDLSGSFGDILGAGIETLPGGDDAPSGDGWCLTLDPGTATVVRMQEGIEPLVVLYIPDLKVNVGIKDDNDCEDWLVASMATEVGLRVKEGSKLGIDLSIPEGAILYYGADEYQEAEVVTGLAGYLEGIIGLVGGFAEIDLAELLGGGATDELGLPLGDITLEITDSRPLVAEDGSWPEGLYALSMNLWGVEAPEAE